MARKFGVLAMVLAIISLGGCASKVQEVPQAPVVPMMSETDVEIVAAGVKLGLTVNPMDLQSMKMFCLAVSEKAVVLAEERGALQKKLEEMGQAHKKENGDVEKLRGRLAEIEKENGELRFLRDAIVTGLAKREGLDEDLRIMLECLMKKKIPELKP